jgi:hypothetical protein
MTTPEEEKEFENLAAYETDSDEGENQQAADTTKQVAEKSKYV